MAALGEIVANLPRQIFTCLAPPCAIPANFAAIREDFDAERQIIAEARANQGLLVSLSRGKIGDFLHGETVEDRFYTKDFTIMAKTFSEKLSDISDLPRRYREQRRDAKDQLGMDIQAIRATADQWNNSPEIEPAVDVPSVNLGEGSSLHLGQTTPISINSKDMLTPHVCDLHQPVPVPVGLEAMVRRMGQKLSEFEVLEARLHRLKMSSSCGLVLYGDSDDWGCPDCPIFSDILAGCATCLQQRCPNFRNLLAYLHPSYSSTLVDIFWRQSGTTREEAINLLHDRLGIDSRNPYAPPGGECGNWHQANWMPPLPLPQGVSQCIPFNGPQGNILGYALISYTASAKTIVPLVGMAHGASRRAIPLHVPFESPAPLLNWEQIANNPSAEICLTDSVELAYLRTISSDETSIYTAWLGGSRTAFNVNWNILKGHKVKYCLFQHSGLSKKAHWETALAAISKLRHVQGVTVDVDDSDFAPSQAHLYPLARNQWPK